MTDDIKAAPPSCSNCPSFLAESELGEQVEVFGNALKLPTCPFKGKLLGGRSVPVRENEKIQEAVARTCSSYGKTAPRSSQPQPSLTVALPMPQIGRPETIEAQNRQPSNCRRCQYFIPAKVMQEEIGITSGFCVRTGVLVAEQNGPRVAKACTVGAPAPHVDWPTQEYVDATLADVMILPELRPVLKVGEKIGSNLPEPEAVVIDPQDYLSDAPVSPEDEAQGIRAYRQVWNDDRSKSVLLPIFRLDYFSPEEQAKIPRTGDNSHPELYKDHQNLLYKVAVIWKLEETPALHGIAGTGKTQFFHHAAWLLGLPFERVSITASSELDDLAGKTHYTPERGTFFEMGRIPKAWAKPCVQVIDEPNVGSPSVWQFIRPMTDNAKQLVLDMDEGRVVDRHPHSYLGMAMNPAWDFRNVGAEVISDADGSRLMHIFVDFPDEKIEKEILRKQCELDGYKIPADKLNKIMAIAKILREMAREGTIPITWGIRPQIKVARALNWFSFPEAYRLAAADYLEPEAQEAIISQVNLKAS